METIACQERRAAVGRGWGDGGCGSSKVGTELRQGLDYIRDERILQQRLTRRMDKNKPKGE